MTDTRDTAPNDIIVGLDLGQAKDWTALDVVEALRPPVGGLPRYAVRTLDRWHPKRYQDVVARIERMVPKLREGVHVLQPNGTSYDYVRPNVTLVLDRTGVGRAVGDLFSEAELDLDLQLVSIHGGDTVTQDPHGGWRVPKRDLVGAVSVVLENDRLDVPAQLTEAATLKAELKNFRARIGANGHDSYGAGDDWREGNHDDLVLAVALSLWWGERGNGAGFEPIPGELRSVLQGMGV